MHFLDTSNSASLCTGLKANGLAGTTQGTVYLFYLVINSGRTSLTTRNSYQLGTSNFRCIGVYHDTSVFYALIENLSSIYMYSLPLTGGTITKRDLTQLTGGKPYKSLKHSLGFYFCGDTVNISDGIINVSLPKS